MIKSHHYFYVRNGVVIKDKRELLDFVKSCDSETFSFHVNLEKNDFANWVKDVLKDVSLAKKLIQTTNKEETASILEESMKRRPIAKRDRKTIINRLVGVIKDG